MSKDETEPVSSTLEYATPVREGRRHMRILVLGAALTLAATIWLLVSSSMGESPLHYVSGRPWYNAGTNLNFVLYNLFAPIAHAILGAGIAIYIVRR